MERFELRQDERDERRRTETVKSQAVSFISKHYANRGLVPLCAMAAMHNSLFYYSREMYRDFCCMTSEVQNLILEYCEFDLRVRKVDGFFWKCVKATEDVLRERFPDDESPFYDGGKYVLRSLERYGSERVLIEHIDRRRICASEELGRMAFPRLDEVFLHEDRIRDALSNAFEGEGSRHPIADLEHACGFREESEIKACQFAVILARYVAIYGGEGRNLEKNYGAPGGYAGEPIETMEDLFLLSVFEMYTRLVLEDENR